MVPGCDVAMGLEIDHWQTDLATAASTALGNLARLCHFHHSMKTYRGFDLGAVPGNGSGTRRLISPRAEAAAHWVPGTE